VVSLKAELHGGPPTPWPRRAPILLIEDDFAIRRTLAQVLTEEGYDVRCAANGREALVLLADRAGRPGLIILDLWMPSMNGLEFRRLQQGLAEWAEIPVVVITASRLLPRELSALGLDHVLRKPLDLDQLLAKVTELTRH
jgi:DNA-binding response OmpR family regulator